MNVTQILDASALLLLTAQAGWIGLLYRRMGRLRSALDGAGEVIGQLDAASRRLDTSAGGIVQTVRDGIAEVDSKIGSCRRLALELSSASRHAEEVATRLDQALRQNRRLQTARAAAPPRELAEPLGLAERLAGRPGGRDTAGAPPPQPVLDAPAAHLDALDLPALDLPLLDPAPSRPEPKILEAEALEAPSTPALPPLLSLVLEEPLPALPEPPPLGSVLAAELLFAGRGPAASPRTVRVKLD